ncbi:SMR family transporter [Chitinibacter tainanensis]|uniref:SMR family transporter n=1 Tax=Chitinibacter tainanensis TaxID=230667 RepID=UPI00042A30E0|nr:SMR family transporter [Chitinibacter tainanensis]
MSAISWALILSGVMLNAIAQLLLKAGTRSLGEIGLHPAAWGPTLLALAGNLPILTGLACYVLSVLVWIAALSRVEVSVAYPMLSLGYVLNALLAYYCFGEALSVQRVLGITVILAGVLLVARSAGPH